MGHGLMPPNWEDRIYSPTIRGRQVPSDSSRRLERFVGLSFMFWYVETVPGRRPGHGPVVLDIVTYCGRPDRLRAYGLGASTGRALGPWGGGCGPHPTISPTAVDATAAGRQAAKAALHLTPRAGASDCGRGRPRSSRVMIGTCGMKWRGLARKAVAAIWGCERLRHSRGPAPSGKRVWKGDSIEARNVRCRRPGQARRAGGFFFLFRRAMAVWIGQNGPESPRIGFGGKSARRQILRHPRYGRRDAALAGRH